MEEKRAGVMNKVHPDLRVPPHVVEQLIDFVAGEKLPDPPQLEQMARHLSTCPYCRTRLIMLLSNEQKNEFLSAADQATIHDLLAKVVGIHAEIEALGYEQIAAYAEAIVAKGKAEADKHFSVLAGHIRRCQSCTAILEEMLDFLNETDETN